MASKRKFEGLKEDEGRFQKKLSCSEKDTVKGSPLLNLPRELRDMILIEACRDRVVEIANADVGSMTNMSRWPGGLGTFLVQPAHCRREHNEDRFAKDHRSVIEVCHNPALKDDIDVDKGSLHSSPRPGSTRNLPLLYVCHQIRGEAIIAANITYTSSEFSFPTLPAFIGLAAMIGEKDLTAIKKVRILHDWEFDLDDLVVLLMIKGIICGFFSGLEELHLQFVKKRKRSSLVEEFSARLVRAEKEGLCGHVRKMLMVEYGLDLSDATSNRAGILVHCKGIHLDTFIRRVGG